MADVFKWKISASLEGQERLLKNLLERADAEARATALAKIGNIVRIEQQRLVPRETGELQGEIRVEAQGDEVRVGIFPDASPEVQARARATNEGSWNYTVGSPDSPKTEWRAKSKPTAAMPWLRTSVLTARPRILRYLRRFFITGRRGRDLEP